MDEWRSVNLFHVNLVNLFHANLVNLFHANLFHSARLAGGVQGDAPQAAL